jgi:hypothetical protein
MSYNKTLTLVIFSFLALGTASCASSGAEVSGERPGTEQTRAVQDAEDRKIADGPADDAEQTDEVLVLLQPGRIAVGGQVVVELEYGDVPEGAKKGGKAGYLIEPLYEHLVTAVMEQQKEMLRQGHEAEKPPVRISTAPGLDFRVLTEVLYTVGQSSVTEYRVELSRGDDELPAVDMTTLTGGEPMQPELSLAVNVGADGFLVVENGEPVDSREACPPQTPTFCLLENNRSGLETLAADAKSAEVEGNLTAADKAVSAMSHAYDFRRLYNSLVELEAESSDGLTLYLSAEQEIPVGLVARVMSLASRRLPEASYDDRETFREALSADERAGVLFENIQLAVAPPTDDVPIE